MLHGDICDTLAGKYPKDFKWTGWHPNDMCYCIPILKTEDEFFSLDIEHSENEVTALPIAMQTYLIENKNYIINTRQKGTEPLWLKDNKELLKQLFQKLECL